MSSTRSLLATAAVALVLSAVGCARQEADSGSPDGVSLPEAVETRLPRPELKTALLAPANMEPAFRKEQPFSLWWYKGSVRWRCLDAVGKLVEGNLRNTAIGTFVEPGNGRVYVEQVLTSYPATPDAERRFTVLESAMGDCTHDRGYVLQGTEAVYDMRVESQALRHPDRLAMQLTGNLYAMDSRPSKVSWSVVITQTANHINLLTVGGRPQDAYVDTLFPALLRISLTRLDAVTRGEPPPLTRVPTRR